MKKNIINQYLYCVLILMISISFNTTILGQVNTSAFQGASDNVINPMNDEGVPSLNKTSGAVGYSVPLFKMQGDKLSHSVSLSYSSSGLKVDEYASRVGLGWRLNAGGMISRAVKGLPDESIRYTRSTGGGASGTAVDWFNFGYLHQVDSTYLTTPTESALQRMTTDAQPDEFNITCAGISTKFIFLDDGSIQTIPYNPNIDSIAPSFVDIGIASNLLINPQVGHEINGFIVTTNQGLEYTFSVSEREHFGTSNEWGNTPYAAKNKWYLSEIRNLATNETMTFEYTTLDNNIIEYLRNSSAKGVGELVLDECEWFAPYTSSPNKKTIHAPKVLTSINYRYGSLELLIDSETRLDRTNDIMYKGFRHLNPSDGFIKQINLETSYFDSGLTTLNDNYNKRLKLDAIKQITEDESQELVLFGFDYNGTYVPPRNSNTIDAWGYYRGDDDLSINSVLFPAFWKKEDYLTAIPPYNSGDLEQNGFTLETENDLSGGIDQYDARSNSMATQTAMLERVRTLQGGFVEFEYEANEFKVVSRPQWIANSGTQNTLNNYIYMGGGVRVSEIKKGKYYTTGTPLYTSTKYTYNNVNSSGQELTSTSSGYIENLPQFAYAPSHYSGLDDLDIPYNDLARFYVSSTAINDPSEFTVAYKSVTEHHDWNGTVGEEGKTVYLYTNAYDSTSPNRDIDVSVSVDELNCGSTSTSELNQIKDYFDKMQLFGKTRLDHRRNLLWKKFEFETRDNLTSYYNTPESSMENIYEFTLMGTQDVPIFKTLKGTYIPAEVIYNPSTNPNGFSLNQNRSFLRILMNTEYRSEWVKLDRTIQMIDGVQTTTINDYTDDGDPYNVASPRRITKIRGNQIIQTDYTFPFDINPSVTGWENNVNVNWRTEMVNRNMQGIPIKKEVYLGSTLDASNQLTDGVLIDGFYTVYDDLNMGNNRLLPRIFFEAKEGTLVPVKRVITYDWFSDNIEDSRKLKTNGYGEDNTQTLMYQYGKPSSTHYGDISTFVSYNSKKLVEEQTDENGIKTRFFYDEFNRIDSIEHTIAEGDTEGLSYTTYEYAYCGVDGCNTYNVTKERVVYRDGTPSQEVWIWTNEFGRVRKIEQIKAIQPTSEYNGDFMDDDAWANAELEFNVYNYRGQITSKEVFGKGTTTYTYERSSLGRLLEKETASNNITTMTYGNNGTESIGDFVAYALTKERITDPNDMVTILLKDMFGNIVRKQVFKDGNSLNNTTLYRYDDYNRISEIENHMGQIYEYHYDNRDMLIQKVEPGNKVTDYFYDNLYRLMARQDGNGNITGYNYDNNNRVITSGVLSAMPTVQNAYPQTFVRTLTENVYIPDTDLIDYSTALLLKDGVDNYVETDYTYDNYYRIEDQIITREDITLEPVSYHFDYNNAGLITSTELTNPYLTSAIVQTQNYDARLKPRETYKQGVLTSKIEYNNLNQVHRKYIGQTDGDNWLQVMDYSYDGSGRLLFLNEDALEATDCQQVGELCDYVCKDISVSDTNEALLEIIRLYTSVGEIDLPNFPYKVADLDLLESDLTQWMTDKGFIFSNIEVGLVNSTTIGIQKINIEIKETDILIETVRVKEGVNTLNFQFYRNNCCATPQVAGIDEPSDLFSMGLIYDGLNIDQMSWKVMCQNKQQYTYTYNNLNYLESASYAEFDANNNSTNVGRYNMNATYDEIGNILTLRRYGQFKSANVGQVGGPPPTGYTISYGKIDDLTYIHNLATGRLDQVNDYYDPQSFPGRKAGFKNGISNYTYDANGNVTNDSGKGMTTTYNHLNLPSVIDVAPINTFFASNGNEEGQISFLYDANGIKHQKIVRDGNGNIVLTRDYFPQVEIRNDTLEAIYLGDVRITSRNGDGTEMDKFEYSILDYQGNVRVSFSDLNQDGVITQSDVLQQQHYYPFGMNMEGEWTSNLNFTTKNKYQYNGKEFNEDLGLNMNDYGARWYDPATARWTVVDPLAERHHDITPYAYVLNNPMRYIDPTGMTEDDPEDPARLEPDNINDALLTELNTFEYIHDNEGNTVVAVEVTVRVYIREDGTPYLKVQAVTSDNEFLNVKPSISILPNSNRFSINLAIETTSETETIDKNVTHDGGGSLSAETGGLTKLAVDVKGEGHYNQTRESKSSVVKGASSIKTNLKYQFGIYQDQDQDGNFRGFYIHTLGSNGFDAAINTLESIHGCSLFSCANQNPLLNYYNANVFKELPPNTIPGLLNP